MEFVSIKIAYITKFVSLFGFLSLILANQFP